jgi:hypothetical protein
MVEDNDMKEKKLTKLEKGIIVHIDSENLDILKELYDEKGFLDYKNYPDEYKEISLYGEAGRFMLFRFILK